MIRLYVNKDLLSYTVSDYAHENPEDWIIILVPLADWIAYNKAKQLVETMMEFMIRLAEEADNGKD